MSRTSATRGLFAFCVGLIVIAVLNGAAEPLLTPFWATIQRRLAIGDAHMGVVISGIAVGLAVGTVAGRFAQARWGWRAALIVAACVFFPALALVPLPGLWWGVLAANVLWGIGNGALDVIWGALASRFERATKSSRRHLVGLAALKELGSGAGAIAGGLALGATVNAGGFMAGFGITAAIVAIVAIALMPRLGAQAKPGDGSTKTAEVKAPAWLTRQVRFLSMLAISAAITLGAMYGWSAQLLDRLGVPGGWVASGLFAFVFLRALILGTAWYTSGRVAPRAWVVRGGAVALVGSILIAAGGGTASAVFVVCGMALVGGGLAAASTLAMSVAGQSASAAQVGAAKEDAAVGLVVVLNHVGISSGPFVVGALSSLLGLEVALPAVMVACCVAVVVLAGRALTVGPTEVDGTKKQRVLRVLAKAPFEDPESDGWMSAYAVWENVERNRFGWRMSLASASVTLARLTLRGLTESKWEDRAAPKPRRRVYRITEAGHRERSMNPVRAR